MTSSRARFGLRTLLGLVAACAFGLFVGRAIWNSGPIRSTFTQPPPQLGAERLGNGVLLFEGKSPQPWVVDGHAAVLDGTLEVGGANPTTAYFPTDLGMDFELSFDFFQEGPGAAEFRVKTVALDPNDKYTKNVKTDLNRSNFVYKRWHHAVVDASYRSGHFNVDINVEPIGDGYGGSASAGFGFPTNGCRCRIEFETSGNSKVYLRNVLLKSKDSLLPDKP